MYYKTNQDTNRGGNRMTFYTDIESFNHNLLSAFNIVKLNPSFFNQVESEYFTEDNRNENSFTEILRKLSTLNILSNISMEEYIANEKELHRYVIVHEVMIDKLAQEVNERLEQANEELTDDEKDYYKMVFTTLLTTVENYPITTQEKKEKTDIKEKKKWLEDELQIIKKL